MPGGGSAVVTLPSSAGSQSQRVRATAASPRPSAVTCAQHARSPAVPVAQPGPPLGEDPETDLRPRPVTDDQQHAPPPPQRGLQALPDLGRRLRGRPQQDELAPVEQRRDHLRPGVPRIGDQQGPLRVQA